MISADNPILKRPQIWDSVLHKRRSLFWNEIDDTQREAEINYQIEQNKKLLRSIKDERIER